MTVDALVLPRLREPCTCSKGVECHVCLVWRRSQAATLGDIPDEELREDETFLLQRLTTLEQSIATKQKLIQTTRAHIRSLQHQCQRDAGLAKELATLTTRLADYRHRARTAPFPDVCAQQVTKLERELVLKSQRLQASHARQRVQRELQDSLDVWLAEVEDEKRLRNQYKQLTEGRYHG